MRMVFNGKLMIFWGEIAVYRLVRGKGIPFIRGQWGTGSDFSVFR